jgi:tight adherence protein C
MSEKRRELIEKIRNDEEPWKLPDKRRALESEGAAKRPIMNFLASLGRKLSPDNAKDQKQIKLRFLRAGLRRENIPGIFWGVKISLTVVFLACFLLTKISLLELIGPSVTLGFCVLFSLAGFYLPDLWLALRTAKRKNNIFRGFPDALDLMVICVEAGMGLDAAIHKVAEEIQLTSKELSDELRQLTLELRAGKSRREALRNLGIRVGIEEIKGFVTLLVQTDKFGTSVAQALRVFSESFRKKRFFKAEELGEKIPLKLVFPMLFCILPSLFVVIMGPAIINISKALIKT